MPTEINELFDVNNMGLNECIEWLMRARGNRPVFATREDINMRSTPLGWAYRPNLPFDGEVHFQGIEECQRHNFGMSSDPAVEMIPSTLDEAAKLPEGWWYRVVTTKVQKDGPVWYDAHAHPWHQETPRCFVSGETELLARFRLRVAVERAERSKTHD